MSRLAATAGSVSPLRFALLAHDHPTPGFPTPHFDLLIEDPRLIPSQGPGTHRCRTWRLHADPRTAADGAPGAVRAEPIAPHRAFYLDYEGPVSGARGTVVRLDGGAVAWESGESAVFTLFGERLTGRWRAAGDRLEPLPDGRGS